VRWEGCIKIHEGCGGMVRWVEAIDKPGVGYFGECMNCGDELVVEQIIPIEDIEVLEANRVKIDEKAELEWNDDSSWDENQEQLKQEIESRL